MGFFFGVCVCTQIYSGTTVYRWGHGLMWLYDIKTQWTFTCDTIFKYCAAVCTNFSTTD